MPPDLDRPAELLRRAGELGVTLPAAQAELLLRYLDAMLERNRAVNLTAIRAPGPALVLHVLDSLAIGRMPLAPRLVLDLGSGNGFPGVAVAALWPDASVALVERTAKKARALAEVTRQAGFAHVSVVCADAAQLPALQPRRRHAADLLTARAVGTPQAMGRLAAPLAAPRAALVLWLDADAEAPPSLPGGWHRQEVLGYALPEPAARARRLARYTKV
ncbi:MAG: class I SAM-dependent methyltransferase [Planctomycetes bacterium]|nr:class I SAM-dependent methyltransferase [Planctomycetota bacterium]